MCELTTNCRHCFWSSLIPFDSLFHFFSKIAMKIQAFKDLCTAGTDNVDDEMKRATAYDN